MRIQKIAHKNIPEHHNRKQGNVKRKEKKKKTLQQHTEGIYYI